MPYLNLDINYFNNIKTVRLVGLLGRGAAELPLRLWAHCGANIARAGSLAGYSAQEIEALVGWWGKSGEAVEAMVKVGLLDVIDDGYQVHDWDEHEGHLISFHERAKEGAKQRWKSYRNASSIASSNAKVESKQCSSRTIPAVPTKPKDKDIGGKPPNSPPASPESTEYVKPDPKTNPNGTLVYAYKLKKKIPSDDRVWDKTEWGRASKTAKLILEVFDGDLRAAVKCIDDLGDAFNKADRTWTIETILRHSHEYKQKKKSGGGSNGAISRSRVFGDFSYAKTIGGPERSRGFSSAGEVIARIRDLQEIQPQAGAGERSEVSGNAGIIAHMGKENLETERNR